MVRISGELRPGRCAVDRRTRYSGHSQPVRVHLQLLYPGNGGQGGRDRRKVQFEAAGGMDTLPAISERHFPGGNRHPVSATPRFRRADYGYGGNALSPL